MFNKFEILGIGISVVVMAVGLYLVRLENFFLSGIERQQAAISEAGLRVIDSTRGVESSELRSALEASARNGRISELIVTDVRFGTGDEVKAGDTVAVNYVGTLQNGQEFDNSYKRGQPFIFKVGAGNVIQGWEEGIVGMKVGGQRVLVIPSDKAYGSRGFGPIPGNATLVFSIELMSIQ